MEFPDIEPWVPALVSLCLVTASLTAVSIVFTV
jgi:hypothetical protein